jgi:prepilin-type N-terminal cleavage/methylation domain-containing protein
MPSLSRHGFTLLEVILVMGIFVLLFSLSAVAISRTRLEVGVTAADSRLTSILTTAARRAMHGEEAGPWGVYLPYDETSRNASEVVLFSGTSYAARNPSFDLSYSFPDQARFVSVELSGVLPSSGNDHEMVFSIFSGDTGQYGTIELEWLERERTILVTPDGVVTREL